MNTMNDYNLGVIGTSKFGVTKNDLIYDESGYVIGTAAPLTINKIEVNSNLKPMPSTVEMVETKEIYVKNTMPAYKYNEDKYISELFDYIDKTYSQHYSQNKFQATEFIIDAGLGTGFCMGNVIKYAQRYGRKGSPEDWRKDLLKVIHYAIMQLNVHDLENGSK